MSVRAGTTDRAITAFGGAELLREAGRAVGLAGELDDCLRLKKRARGLSDTEFVMGMVLLGGEPALLGALGTGEWIRRPPPSGMRPSFFTSPRTSSPGRLISGSPNPTSVAHPGLSVGIHSHRNSVRSSSRPPLAATAKGS